MTPDEIEAQYREWKKDIWEYYHREAADLYVSRERSLLDLERWRLSQLDKISFVPVKENFMPHLSLRFLVFGA